jgi:hypothetical protein
VIYVREPVSEREKESGDCERGGGGVRVYIEVK